MAMSIKKGAGREVYTGNQVVLMNAFNKIWMQQFMWMRFFIISSAADLDDLSRVTKRLLQVPKDFAKLFRPFYGKSKADEVEALFQEHIVLAAKLIINIKVQKTQAVRENRVKWYDNADRISEYFAKINPNWSKHEWQTLLYEHLKMTENEAVERFNGQFEADIMQYEGIEKQAVTMAELMSKGIIKQSSYR